MRDVPTVPPGVFKECPLCGHQWLSRSEFLSDSEVEILGYQVSYEDLNLGLLYFNHLVCRTTFTIEAGDFADLYEGEVFQESRAGTEDCPEYCHRIRELRPCPVECECAYVREIIQVIRSWNKVPAPEK
ncbi:hypothetical protein JW916_01965 [Candidatus Sumerlaeota bacterium]|nr:hypothetical protein [Candidatus Sumerlaeota bacterium]